MIVKDLDDESVFGDMPIVSCTTVRLCIVATALVLSVAARSSEIKCRPKPGPFSEDSCAWVHSESPEGWVRGYASLDDSEKLKIKLVLVTDSVTAGPCGKLSVQVLGENGALLASISMGRAFCRGGKPPGKAASSELVFEKNLPAGTFAKARSLSVSVEKTGSRESLYNIAASEDTHGIVSAVEVLKAE
jgi:hypothetical protein